MILNGYLDGFEPPVDPDVLVDATDWLDAAAVWSGLLYSVGGSATAAHAFNVDPADVDAVLTELSRDDQWPVFTAKLAGGHKLHLVWRNYAGDSGWDYLLAARGHAKLLEIAALEGHFRGPAVSWSELLGIAGQLDADLKAGQRRLLMLPALGDASLPDDAVEVVADAVGGVGVVRRHDDVAKELLTASRRFWGSPEWSELLGMPVCLGPHSLRGPGRDRDELALIADALGGIDG